MMIFLKDPDAVLDYVWDWSQWLQAGEAITSYSVIAPTGITKASDARDGALIVAWLSGGTNGQSYQVTCRTTTNQGRTDDRSITLRVLDR